MNIDWNCTRLGRGARFAAPRAVIAVAGAILLTAAAQAPSPPPAKPPAAPPGKMAGAEKAAGSIMMQPAQDVGISKLKVPAVLAAARENPYGLTGLKTCGQLVKAVNELNEVLGADFAVGREYSENRTGKLAEAGGRAVVNSLIPYRGLVREVTGAGPAQRRLTDAINAGYARRGFLRGVHSNRRCKGAFAADVVRENKALR